MRAPWSALKNLSSVRKRVSCAASRNFYPQNRASSVLSFPSVTGRRNLVASDTLCDTKSIQFFSTFQPTRMRNDEGLQEVPKSFSGAQVAPPQSIRGLTKFYKEATHTYDEADNMWFVQLDGKPVRTPRKNVVKLESEELAFAVAHASSQCTLQA